jgi:G3E family GTPase
MAIESLMERRGTFDYILLETTGLADPGNLAPVFWVDDNLGSSIYLDGIVTLVDAKNILRLLDEPAPEETESNHIDGTENEGPGHSGPVLSMAHMQISHADVIILNKADLVTQEELDHVRSRILAINSVAKIHVTDHSRTPQIEGVVLDLHAYDHLDSLDFGAKGHSHIDPVHLPRILISSRHLLISTGNINNRHNPTPYTRRQSLTGRRLAPVRSMGIENPRNGQYRYS